MDASPALSAQQRCDDILLTVAQQTEGIEGFLDSVFGFLQRRSDFFHQQASTNDPIGFPEGQALQIVQKLFATHRAAYQQRQAHHNRAFSSASAPSADAVPAAARATLSAEHTGAPEHPQETEDPKRLDPYNGGRTAAYHWSQTLRDVTLEAKLPPPHPVFKSSMRVVLQDNALHVQCEGQTLVKGVCFEPVKASEYLWWIEDGDRFLMTLEKQRENWWPSVLQGEAQTLNLSTIEATRKFEDCDPETQASIYRVLCEHDQRKTQV